MPYPGMRTGAAPLPRHHRAMFLSDLHLGARGCRADLILGFLQRNTADTIYLVGDILDLWHPLTCAWSPAHDRIIDTFAAHAAAGGRLIYLVGNHDHAMRDAAYSDLLPAEVRTEITHVTADGQRYLVVHGDVCDLRFLRPHIFTRIGSRIDGMLRATDGWLRALRRRLDPEDRTPIEMLLSWLNAAIYAGQAHERRLIPLARQTGHDGVICGHFHIAALHDDHGLTYANCGDWVDSFTALGEAPDGRLTLLDGRKPLPQPVTHPAPLGGGTQAAGL